MIRKLILKIVSPLIDDAKGDSIVRDEGLRFQIAGLNKRIEKLEMIIKKCRLYDDTDGGERWVDITVLSNLYTHLSGLYRDKKPRVKPVPVVKKNSTGSRDSKRIVKCR